MRVNTNFGTWIRDVVDLKLRHLIFDSVYYLLGTTGNHSLHNHKSPLSTNPHGPLKIQTTDPSSVHHKTPRYPSAEK